MIDVTTWFIASAATGAAFGVVTRQYKMTAAWFVILSLLATACAFARDTGQWENIDPAVHEWYRNLTRPDVPTASCCAESDAYYADVVHIRDGKTYAVVTDDRPDGPLGRPHIVPGTEFEVPPEKLKWDSSNPTGHNILFVSMTGFTWCFVQGTGI